MGICEETLKILATTILSIQLFILLRPACYSLTRTAAMVVVVVLNILTITSTVKSTSNMLTWRRQDARLSAGGRCPSTRPNPDPRDRERERRLDAKTILNVIVHHTVTNNIKFLTIGILHYNSPLPFYQQLSATMQELCKNRYNLQDFQKFRAKGFLQVTPWCKRAKNPLLGSLVCALCTVCSDYRPSCQTGLFICTKSLNYILPEYHSILF